MRLTQAKSKNVLLDEPKISGIKAVSNRYYFFTIFLFSVCINLIKFPNFTLGGEMWAEMGTNYYPNSLSPNLRTKFFATDAGYVPFPTRWIAAAYSYLDAPSVTIPYAYTFIAVVLTAIMTSLFMKPIFRPVIESDAVRFLVCICVSICADFETRTFINFPYILSFYLLACLILLAKGKFDIKYFLAIPLFIASKPLLLALLPIFCFVILSWLRKKHRGAFFLTLAVTLLSVIQTVTILESRKTGVLSQQFKPNLLEILSSATGYTFGFLAKPFTLFLGVTGGTQIGIGFMIFLLILIALKNNWIQNRIAIVIVLISIFNFMLLNSIAVSDTFNDSFQLFANATPVFRYTVPIIGALVLLAGIVVDQITSAKKQIRGTEKLPLALMLLITVMMCVFGLRQINEPTSPTLYSSHWAANSIAIDDGENICVPVNPNGWTFGRGCRVIAQGVTWPSPNGLTREEIKPYRNYPLKIDNVKSFENIMAIGILVAPVSQKTTNLLVTIEVELDNGEFERSSEIHQINASGSLIYSKISPTLKIESIVSIEVSFTSKLVLINQPTNYEDGLLATIYGN